AGRARARPPAGRRTPCTASRAHNRPRPPALAWSACRDPPGPRDPVRARQERPAAPDRDPPVNACSRHYRERVFMTIREKGDIRHGANTFPRSSLWKTTFLGTPPRRVGLRLVCAHDPTRAPTPPPSREP